MPVQNKYQLYMKSQNSSRFEKIDQPMREVEARALIWAYIREDTEKHEWNCYQIKKTNEEVNDYEDKW